MEALWKICSALVSLLKKRWFPDMSVKGVLASQLEKFYFF
jgi:hypothetical protein